MVVSALTLALLAASLVWAVVFRAGVWASDWEVSLVLTGVAAILFAVGRQKERLNAPWQALLLFSVPTYLLCSLIPLPLPVLSILSPSRAHLLEQLQVVSPFQTTAPLSVNPPATFLALFSVIAWIATFLLIYGVATRMRRRLWITILPLLVLSAFEAALGLYQVFGQSSAFATGTYTNRDHFAGFLEMVFPFAVLQGVSAFKNGDRFDSGSRRAVLACVLWGVAAVIFLAIAYSLSRMGFIVILFEGSIIAAVLIGKRGFSSRRRIVVLASLAAVFGGFMFLMPDQLTARFSTLAAKDEVTKEIRLSIWKDTLPLIREFPVFGCGMGGYESVFMRHQTEANEYGVEFAHNDYLQFLAELGIVGFMILATVSGAAGRKIVRGLKNTKNESHRLLLWSCIAALSGMLLHSIADFNLYIPANAMTFAWIAGLAFATASEPALPGRSRQRP